MFSIFSRNLLNNKIREKFFPKVFKNSYKPLCHPHIHKTKIPIEDNPKNKNLHLNLAPCWAPEKKKVECGKTITNIIFQPRFWDTPLRAYFIFILLPLCTGARTAPSTAQFFVIRKKASFLELDHFNTSMK